MRHLKESLPLSQLDSALNFSGRPNLHGDISCVGSISNLMPGVLSFSTTIPSIEQQSVGTIFVPEDCPSSPNLIRVANPRLAFFKAICWLNENVGFVDIQQEHLGDNIRYGKNFTMGRGVVIGSDVHIGNNVVLGDFAIVGNGVIIKSGSIIGEDGHGFERDDNGVPIRFPHIGHVVIGDHTEIGSNVTINKGTLDCTLIGRHVKIDDQVHIAHNVIVEDNSIITAGAIVGGSVVIRKGVWLGLNSAIHQKKIIGENAIIGIGANVFSNVPENTTQAGFPSRTVPK
jgi:UDP-3-O-[3-hydroxymyristoyl] glucosamine N-acyltransferase